MCLGLPPKGRARAEWTWAPFCRLRSGDCRQEEGEQGLKLGHARLGEGAVSMYPAELMGAQQLPLGSGAGARARFFPDSPPPVPS